MRKEIRRFLMLCTIVTVGLILLFLNVTFIQLLVILIAVGIILPFLLGMITVAEVREAFTSFKEQKLKKISLLKKLDEIKIFEKKPASARPDIPQPKMPARPDTAAQPAKKPDAAGGGAGKYPFFTQINSIATSLKSLGTIIKERTKRERKESDINRMLDSAVSEKVSKPAPVAAPAPQAPGGPGSSAETDPFLSLSGDEFDAGLLDGLDDDDMAPGTGGSVTDQAPGPDPGMGSPDMSLPEPELSVPSMDLDSAAGDILKANAAEGLDEFEGLEAGGDDSDDLADLDNLSLDDVELDAELDDGESDDDSAGAAPSPDADAPPAPGAGAPQEPPGAVKTAWIPSDAPKGADTMEDQIGTQSDMAAFASSSSGSDEDLLSSIASDVKHTTKEKDLSLLRELKDFKAPADQIETELSDMYTRLSGFPKKKDASDTSTNEIK